MASLLVFLMLLTVLPVAVFADPEPELTYEQQLQALKGRYDGLISGGHSFTDGTDDSTFDDIGALIEAYNDVEDDVATKEGELEQAKIDYSDANLAQIDSDFSSYLSSHNMTVLTEIVLEPILAWPPIKEKSRNESTQSLSQIVTNGYATRVVFTLVDEDITMLS
jgi:hypothetical protein